MYIVVDCVEPIWLRAFWKGFEIEKNISVSGSGPQKFRSYEPIWTSDLPQECAKIDQIGGKFKNSNQILIGYDRPPGQNLDSKIPGLCSK